MYTFRIWDARTGKPISSEIKHDKIISNIKFSPDSKWFITFSYNTARIWDAETGDLIEPSLQLANVGIWSISFSPDWKYLVTAHSDGAARVWDIKGRKPISPALRHTSITFSK